MNPGRLNHIGVATPFGADTISVIASEARQSSGTIALDCRVALLLTMTMMMVGCSALGQSEQKLSCRSSPNLNGTDKDLASAESRQAQAIVGIKLAKRVSEQAKSAWFGTGALAGAVSRVPGTEASSLAINVRQLRTMVADQRAIDLALGMDGKSQLPSKADWACQILADSVASLDTGQSDEQFLENVAVVEDNFGRIFESNSGPNLGAELKNAELK
jgi:hypothetical protein